MWPTSSGKRVAEMSGDGHEALRSSAGQMRKALFLTVLILAVEVAGGVLSHSLALLADAGHVLTDVAAIGLSWYALSQSMKPADEKMTFGYHRSQILAALFNGVTLIVVTLVILWEAYGRFLHPQAVVPAWMFASAGIGLIVNLYLGLGMRHHDNLNVKSAVLHMLGDAGASGGVIVAGILISLTHWYVVDPVLSALIAGLIAIGAWRVVRQTIGILMEATPRGIDLQEVIRAIRSVPGVKDVHDVHLWSITSGKNALSCHVVLDGATSVHENQVILQDLEAVLALKKIGHVTVQTEAPDHPHDASVLCKDEAPRDEGRVPSGGGPGRGPR